MANKLRDISSHEKLREEFLIWNKDRKNLRFGQYLCNKYLNISESLPELFYCEVTSIAYEMVCKDIDKWQDYVAAKMNGELD